MPEKKNENKSIFVSSTFRDMQAERDMLRDYVLPRVNEFAARYGRAAELIDLRWGVDTAGISPEEQNRKVLRTCLDEIKRSRPFFIGILGDRYGWVPPEEVMSDTLNAAGYEASTFDQSVTALEIEYGALRPSEPPVCLFYFRRIADYSSLDVNAQADYIDQGKSRERLDELKKEIAAKFGSSVKDYEAIIENGEVTGLSAFTDMVADDIKNALRAEWGESPVRPPSDDEQEANALETYRRDKTGGFAGRGGVIRELTDFCLGSGDSQILIVKGEPGSGKSALMCKVMDEIEKQKDCLLLPFACGITPRASHAEGLLRSFIWRLEKRLVTKSGDNSSFHKRIDQYLSERAPQSDEYSSLAWEKRRFFELLHYAKEFRVVAVVDALDQLSGGAEARNMLWISGSLPDNFRLLCSIIDGPEITAAKKMGGKIYPLPEMNGKEMGEIIRAIANKHHKQLSDAVVRYILMKMVPCASGVRQAAQNPLYLNLLIQDLAMMNRYEHAVIDKYAAETDRAGNKIRTLMDAINLFMKERISETPPDPEGAFMSVAARVGKLIDADVGRDFVLPVLCMIAVSRSGLRESDLEGTFAKMGQGFGSADFAWLRQMLRGLFMQGDALQWNFTHESLRRALKKNKPEELSRVNDGVIEHFCAIVSNDSFAAQEVMHHLCFADRPDTAAELLGRHSEARSALTQGLADTYIDYYGEISDKFLFAIISYASEPGYEKQSFVADAIRVYMRYLPEDTREFKITQLEKALSLLGFRDTGQVQESLFSHNLNEEDWQREAKTVQALYDCHMALGDILFDSGDMEGAGKHYHYARGNKQMIYELDKTAVNLWELAKATARYARYLESIGNVPLARENYDNAYEWMNSAYDQDPTTDISFDLGELNGEIGDFYNARGELGMEVIRNKVALFYDNSCKAASELLNYEETVRVRKALADAWYRKGRYAAAQGDFDKANYFFHNACNQYQLVCDRAGTAKALSDLENAKKWYCETL